MNETWLVYLAGCLFAATGLLFLQRERYERECRRAARWRIEIRKKAVGFTKCPTVLLCVFQKWRNRKAEIELAETVSFLRNTIILGNGRAIGANALLEQLAARGGTLSPAYARMLRLLRQHQAAAAAEAFTAAAGSEYAADLARLLVYWDAIDPAMLLETLLSFQKGMSEKRTTAQKRRDEVLSDLLYLPVVTNVMLVFLNFIYVGYFIDQKEMLTMLL